MIETAETCRRPKEDELIDDIEDIIASYGLRAFIAAVLKSSASDEIGRLQGHSAFNALNWILVEILKSKNPRFAAECMAFGANLLGDDAQTMSAIARRYGQTKANVSRIVLSFCDRLGLEPNARMKTSKARAEYRLTNQPRRKEKTTKEKQL